MSYGVFFVVILNKHSQNAGDLRCHDAHVTSQLCGVVIDTTLWNRIQQIFFATHIFRVHEFSVILCMYDISAMDW